jgi:phosphoribosylamine--glycine ligase
MSLNILVLGSGGREHALAWSIARSPQTANVWVVPGNGGTHSPEAYRTLNITDAGAVADCARSLGAHLVVVGPEAPLAAGIVDALEAQGIATIGPGKVAAQLEASKAFAKAFMTKYGIPTAKYMEVTAAELAAGEAFIDSLQGQAVVKADGLAAGKGVVVCTDAATAKQALREMLLDGRFAQAGSRVVIEELLPGIEMSLFMLTDGRHGLVLPEAKDYKRIGEGDTGPNTGGMGSVSPVPFATPELMARIRQEVVQPTLDGLAAEGWHYKGFVFIGLMIVDGTPYVLEYNVRMGDPETQSVMVRLEDSILEPLLACHAGKLDTCTLAISPRHACTVVLASEGYPEQYPTGEAISGLADMPADVQVFHAGTRLDGTEVRTAGGRVLAVTALADVPQQARALAQQAAARVIYTSRYFRRDIGRDVWAD